MADCDGRFFEVEEVHRGGFRRRGVSLPLSKDGIERILREHVLDVCDEQFLMLLLMMNTENEDRLDLIGKLLISIGEQTVDVRINRRAIALRLYDCWARY